MGGIASTRVGPLHVISTPDTMTSSLPALQMGVVHQETVRSADLSQPRIASPNKSVISSISGDNVEDRRTVEKLIEETKKQTGGFTGSMSAQLPQLMKMVFVVAIPVIALITITALELNTTISDSRQVGIIFCDCLPQSFTFLCETVAKNLQRKNGRQFAVP
jgi:hypothetical protein